MDQASGGWIAEGWSTDSCENFFGQMIVSDARAFQSTSKMQIFDHRSQISIYELDVYFSMRHMTWPMLSWNRHRADNFEMF